MSWMDDVVSGRNQEENLMKKFSHNREEVIYQEIQDQSFLDLLNESGIVPEEIPDDNLRYRVFKYTINNKRRYACVLVANAPDAYIEKIYITFVYPEDGFYNLMLDITGQIDGSGPKMLRSRLSIATEQAENKAKEWIENKYINDHTEWFFNGYPKDVQEEYNQMYNLALNQFGYDLKTLDKINAPDIDMNYMKKILK